MSYIDKNIANYHNNQRSRPSFVNFENLNLDDLEPNLRNTMTSMNRKGDVVNKVSEVSPYIYSKE